MVLSQTPRPNTLPHRVGVLRRKYFPAAVWIVAVVAAVVLYQRQTHRLDAVGIVEIYEVAVGSLESGVIKGLNAELLDQVESGDLLGVLDGSLIEAELRIAQAELERLRAELEAVRTALEQEWGLQARDELAAYRRFLIDIEEARLDSLLLTVEQEVAKIELERLEVVRDRQEEMVRQNIIDQSAYAEARLFYEGTRKKLEENEAALAFCQERIEETERRLAQYTGREIDDGIAELLAPVREAIAVQDARIQAVEVRRGRLLLRAPVSGTITKVFHRAGDPVLAGQIVLAIAVPEASRVVAYIEEGSIRDVDVGTPVEVFSRQRPSTVVTAEVIRVGKTIEELPLHLRRNQGIVQWGLPVMVGGLPEGLFSPGEAVDVRFLR